jgi:hypothetical protein
MDVYIIMISIEYIESKKIKFVYKIGNKNISSIIVIIKDNTTVKFGKITVYLEKYDSSKLFIHVINYFIQKKYQFSIGMIDDSYYDEFIKIINLDKIKKKYNIIQTSKNNKTCFRFKFYRFNFS